MLGDIIQINGKTVATWIRPPVRELSHLVYDFSNVISSYSKECWMYLYIDVLFSELETANLDMHDGWKGEWIVSSPILYLCYLSLISLHLAPISITSTLYPTLTLLSPFQTSLTPPDCSSKANHVVNEFCLCLRYLQELLCHKVISSLLLNRCSQ